MSSTLDRLKALNNKLDAKLTKQSTDKKSKSTASRSRSKTASPENSESDNDIVQVSHTELADTLIKHMNINVSQEPVRTENLKRVAKLYLELGINEKAPDIENLFVYKAMNISGISLKEEDFGEIRTGKYVQVIAITYEPDKNGKKKAKNISLGYFGKAETLDDDYKNEIIEFVLRWRYEKAFQNLEHYRELIDNIHPKGDSLF